MSQTTEDLLIDELVKLDEERSRLLHLYIDAILPEDKKELWKNITKN